MEIKGFKRENKLCCRKEVRVYVYTKLFRKYKNLYIDNV